MSAMVAAKADAIESVLIGGDLAKLSTEQRVVYYNRVCESLGLNPMTQPFAYVPLNGKLLLYARKDATEQLRKRDRVSVQIVAREVVEGVYVVTAKASTPDGRCDESIGAVPIENLKGEARANAMMKAETKAKRRVTLSVCGLGMLDETEVESVPSGRVEVVPDAAPQLPAAPKPDAVADALSRLEQAESLGELKAAWEATPVALHKRLAADLKRLKESFNAPTPPPQATPGDSLEPLRLELEHTLLDAGVTYEAAMKAHGAAVCGWRKGEPIPPMDKLTREQVVGLLDAVNGQGVEK